MQYQEQEYLAEGDDYIPIERWGRDHWNTLAYLETRAVDHGGKIRNANMRTNARLHRHFVGTEFGNVVQDGSAYPTRIKEGVIQKHDDWSCLEDMIAAGLVRSWFWVARHGKMFGDCDARVEFTERGLQVAAELRAHKANGGAFGNFNPTLSRNGVNIHV